MIFGPTTSSSYVFRNMFGPLKFSSKLMITGIIRFEDARLVHLNLNMDQTCAFEANYSGDHQFWREFQEEVVGPKIIPPCTYVK